MKKKVLFIVSVLIVTFLTACSSNGEEIVGDWYVVSVDDYYVDSDMEMGRLEFYDDGTCFDSFHDEECTYKVKGNSVIITYSFKDDSTDDIEYEIFEEKGYKCISCAARYFGQEYILVKGEEEAEAYIDEFSTNPSNIWNYDFAGDYYRANDERLNHLSNYDKMVEMKLAGGGYTVWGGFSLNDDYSGYEHTQYGSSYEISVDMDKEKKTMMLVSPDGYAKDYTIEWSEEIQEWCFYDGSDYWCRLENVE